MQKIIFFNNFKFRLVPYHGQDVHPDTGIAFYVNDGEGGVVGLRRYPNGRMKQINATGTKHNYAYAHGKQEYLKFKDVWGYHVHILASHAVYLAWVGPMQPGMTIDHINGCTTDNRPENLRQVTNTINNRDGGFARKLKKNGFDTMRIDRAYLLRYFDRMAHIKATVTTYRYKHLTKQQLHDILYGEEIFIIH
ncbi:MAG: HNH endonuclease [Paludibacteraceae bacterium]|nr:HNH endonuclease [Paludibacteraceae bacterium]